MEGKDKMGGRCRHAWWIYYLISVKYSAMWQGAVWHTGSKRRCMDGNKLTFTVPSSLNMPPLKEQQTKRSQWSQLWSPNYENLARFSPLTHSGSGIYGTPYLQLSFGFNSLFSVGLQHVHRSWLFGLGYARWGFFFGREWREGVWRSYLLRCLCWCWWLHSTGQRWTLRRSAGACHLYCRQTPTHPSGGMCCCWNEKHLENKGES